MSEIILGTEKSHGKEVRTEIENVSALVIGLEIVIIERIGTTEIGKGIETEIGKGKERETGDVIEIEDVIVVESGIGRGIVIRIENTIVIGKGRLTGDARVIERLIMNLNMRRNIMMVKEGVTVSPRMIMVGTTNLDMDISMQILTMMQITMTTMSII